VHPASGVVNEEMLGTSQLDDATGASEVRKLAG